MYSSWHKRDHFPAPAYRHRSNYDNDLSIRSITWILRDLPECLAVCPGLRGTLLSKTYSGFTSILVRARIAGLLSQSQPRATTVARTIIEVGQERLI